MSGYLLRTGSNHPALLTPRDRMCYFAVGLQHSGLQPFLDQPQQLLVSDPQAQHLNQTIVIESVEKCLDVRFYDEVVRLELELHCQVMDRIQCSPFPPIPITARQEVLLVYGSQYPRD